MHTDIDALFNPPATPLAVDAMFDAHAPAPDPVMPQGYGGKRPRAGRKSKAERDSNKNKDGTEKTEYQKYETGRARKELALAEKAEMDAAVMAGRLVYREDVQVQTTRLLSACSQSLDAIPDDLESKFGLEPDVVEAIRGLIDSSKQELADKLRLMCEHGLPADDEAGDDDAA